MKNVLDVRKLCFSYYKKPLLLKDIEFCVAEKSKTLILACSGVGKSTLLKALSGFDDTYFGQIFYKGKDLKKIPDEEKKFSLLLSEPILVAGTVKKNLDYFCRVNKIDSLSEKQVDEVFSKFGFNAKLNDNVKKLSLVDRRIFAIIRAFLKKPNIIFLDDQFAGLSVEESAVMEKVCNELLVSDFTIICTCGNNTLKEHFEWIKNLKFDEVLYLSNTKVSKYKNLIEFFSKHLNYDVLSFSNDYFSLNGFIIKQDGAYYFATDDGLTLKFDKKFYDKLVMLNLMEMENENVYLCSKDRSLIENLTDSEFNVNLDKNDIWIYSSVDGERVI